MKVWLPLIRTGTGAEVYTYRLAEGLSAKGHAAVVDAVDHKFQYCPWAAPIKPPAGCDVVFGNSWSAAAFSGDIPLVTVIHHVVHDPVMSAHKSLAQSLFHLAFVKPMELAAIKRSARVVAVSQTTANSIRNHLSDAPVSTILNGVDTDYFNPGEREAEGLSDGPIKLLFVGKPSRRKAFDTVAKLVNIMGKQAQFTCVGSQGESGLALPPGDYKGKLSNEELRQAYRKADFLVLPSRLEGFGYVAAEAMACGTPVICAPDGAVAEVADPPHSALTIGDDMQALVAQLLELKSKPSDYQAMRQSARKRAAEKLDEKRWLDEMEALLHSAG